MGVYIYPIDSYNHDVGDYGIVIEEVNFWLNIDFLPLVETSTAESEILMRYQKIVSGATVTTLISI